MSVLGIELLRILLLVLVTTNFVGFAWAIHSLFGRSERMPLAMRSLSVAGAMFAAWHIFEIATVRLHVTAALIGAALYSATLALFWWSVPYARRAKLALAFTTSTSTTLLDYGPYGWVRHPFYASYLLYWISGIVATENLWLLLSAAIMSYFYINAIVREEAELLARPDIANYVAYRARTGCLLPRWGAWKRDYTQD